MAEVVQEITSSTALRPQLDGLSASNKVKHKKNDEVLTFKGKMNERFKRAFSSPE